MNRLSKWILLALLALALRSAAAESHGDFAPAAPESQGLSRRALDDLAATVEQYVESGRIVGATLLVVKNRRTVLHEAYGWQDREDEIPMKRDTIFNIRSMTKPITGTAIQMLIDEGTLSVDDRACTYIPSFDVEPLNAITVDHLLTHRSGLPLGPIMASFNQFDSIGAVAARAAQVGVAADPGSVFQYSDPGSDTLGAILAAASAQSIDSFFQKRIFDPLGMKDTIAVVDTSDQRTSRIASLYVGQEGAWYRIWKPDAQPLYPFAYGSQSVYSTSMDYARFLALWMDGGLAGRKRLLSADAVERALTPRSPMAYPNGFSGTKVCYGQMWMLYMDETARGAESETNRVTLFGHGGSDGTLAWAWPDQDLMVLYFSQSRGQKAGIELDSVVDRLLIHGEEEAEAERPPDREQRLEILVADLEKKRQAQHIPGMAIAVVQDDALVLARGFGLADMEKKTLVTEETLFAIGSTTKAFTAALVGMLVDEGAMQWDDPVANHLPWFTPKVDCNDPGATLTIRDLLSHRTGFACLDLLWAGGNLSREEVLRQATDAVPVAPFREKYIYNNVMFMAAGEAAARAADTGWESLVAERIFGPLSMKSTITSTQRARDDRRLARGYQWNEKKKKHTRLRMRKVHSAAPSGAIISNALDMSNWLRFQLGRGSFGKARLLSERQLRETWTGQIAINDKMSYCLGWALVENDRGSFVTHNGAVGGYASDVTLFPDHDLGVVLLMNRTAAPLLNEARHMVFDALVTNTPPEEKEASLTPEIQKLNLESFDRVWERVNERYWDPDFGGVDWQAVRDELRPRVEKATTMHEVRSLMEEAVGRLGASHFAIIPSEVYRKLDDPADPGSREGVAGLDLRVIDGHALVTAVTEGGPAERAGVRPGWEIVGIGAFDLLARVRELSEQMAPSLTGAYRLWGIAASRLRGPVGKELEISFIDGEGKKVSRTITLARERGRKVRFGHFPDFHVWIDVRDLGDDIGYIAFNGFFDPAYIMTAFNDAMRSFRDTRGVIIDIRGNGGGMGEMCLGMMGWLIQGEGRHLGTVLARDYKLEVLVKPRAETYTGPVAVLVDGLSGSSSEVFASGLQDLGRACIVGSRTGGAVLGCRLERLPNGDGFEYADSNYISAKRGGAVEGTGVLPDIEVKPTRKALLAGRDPVVDAAVQWIVEQTKR